MQTGYFHLQNYKEMLEPQKKKRSFIDRLKRISTNMEHCGTPEIIVMS